MIVLDLQNLLLALPFGKWLLKVSVQIIWRGLNDLLYNFQDGRVNALYSTPSLYTDVKNAANETWPLKTADYFP